MIRRFPGLCALLLLSSAGSARAEDAWVQVVSGPIVIKTRPVPGTGIKETWAEGDMNAEVQDIQATLMDAGSFAAFMPYVKESKEFGRDTDGSRFVYTRIAPPIVGERDYVLRVTQDEGVKPDGTGTFANHWVAVPDNLPEKPGVIRLRSDQGTWRITSKGNGKSHAVHKFAVDPGGWIPTFAASAGNKRTVPDLFKAVEKEAARRGALRRSHKG